MAENSEKVEEMETEDFEQKEAASEDDSDSSDGASDKEDANAPRISELQQQVTENSVQLFPLSDNLRKLYTDFLIKCKNIIRFPYVGFHPFSLLSTSHLVEAECLV